MKRISAFLLMLVVLLQGAAPIQAQSLVPPPAAESGSWSTIAGLYVWENYATADAACRRQMAVYNPAAIYDPPSDSGGINVGCNWHAAPGHGPGVLGATVTFYCPPDMVRTWQATCYRPEPTVCVPCGQKVAASQDPKKGNPITLSTGTKTKTELDYSTADGLLSAQRFYSSIQRGHANSSDHELPGFGYFWHGLIPGRIIISGDNADIAEFHDATGGIDFFSAPHSDTSSYIYTEQGVSRIRLTYVDTATGSRIDYFHTGAVVANGGAEMRIDFASGEYILFRRSNVYRPNATARYLVPIEHGFPGGYKQWFDYSDTGEFPNKVRDSFGRQILIDWQAIPNAPGGLIYQIISALHLPDGTSLTYQYDAPSAPADQAQYYVGNPADRLVSAKHLDAGGAVLWQHSYLYEDPRFAYALTGIVDQNGQRLSTYAYSAAGLASSTQLAGGFNAYSVDYLQDDPSQHLKHYVRNVTGPLGQVETYSFLRDQDAPAGMISTLTEIDRLASATVPAASQTFTYTNTSGSDFLLSSAQDWRGTTSGLVLDVPNGRPTSTTEAQGTSVARTIGTTWHTQFDLPTQEVRQGLTVNYSYDPTGKLLSRTETDTTTQTLPYSTAGQTRTTSYTWDSNGRLLTVNGPLAVDAFGHDDTVALTYDTNGNRRTMTDGLGHVTHYDNYDPNGRAGTMTDMNGIVTAFSYDALGYVKTITVKHPNDTSLDAITLIDYDSEGRIIALVRPATEKLFFDYNAAGYVVSMRAADGERIDYAYDAMGNVTGEAVKRVDGSQARSTVRTFDSLGRMLSEVLGPGRITRWTYDSNGNANTLTNPSNNATTQAFDPLDRLMSTVAPDGGTTGLAYDQKDAIVQNTDPKSVVTTFVRDGFGEVIQEISPDRGTSIYWYDAAGKVTRSQDGRGQIVDYARDILGRVTQKVPQGHTSETIAYSWDTGGLSGSYGVGRLGAIMDASGTTQFAYDHRGNMIAQQQTIGTSSAAQLAYAYDLGDRVTQITYPSGRIVQYGRDTKGRVNLVQTKASASVGSWTVIASNVTYEPFAAMKSMQLGNGLAVANDWGNDGRLASRRLYRTADGTNLSWLTYGYDPNDNIASIVDQLDGTHSVYYGYDVNDRLAMTVSTAATVTPATDTYSYSTGTNQLASITGTAGMRTFGYDARGNLANDNRAGSVSATTAYDSYARLVSYARTDVGTLSFAYNGRDDRVTTTSGTAGTREFIYDPDGRVLGEYGSSATDVKAEFVWMLPQLANDTASFGGDDGLGGYMPLALATPDGAGIIQLNWVHANHLGAPLVTTDSQGNAATTPNDYLAAGFPGQTRTLVDLYYNRYRDYDPTLGRYLQADPIGIDGSQNIYVYVENNPLAWIDPDGLAPRRNGGPWHAPGEPAFGCKYDDTCPAIRGKMWIISRMINSHTGWDRKMPKPRGGNRHAEEIANLWNAFAKCQELLRKKCPECDNNSGAGGGSKAPSISPGWAAVALGLGALLATEVIVATE